MKILGIEFAPLAVPLERRIQTLAAAAWFTILAFGGFIGIIVLFYLLFTRFWWFSVLYPIWIYFDSNTSEQGGRSWRFMQNWRWWYYLKQYFPSKLHLVPEFVLDPQKNYLFCCFPHGVLPAGPFTNIQSVYSEFYEKYPNFNVKTVILLQQFLMPFVRELALGVGCISASSASLTYFLSRTSGGNIALLLPGGAVEAYNSRPGQYKFVVEKRKGFVKIALRTGAPLVPVISFGESDLFDQLEGPMLRRIQEYIRRFLGLAPVVFTGRGFFQYNIGVIPRRKPITTVVGKPIEVPKVENPSREEIVQLHQKFKEELIKLFEEHKHRYIDDPGHMHLQLE